MKAKLNSAWPRVSQATVRKGQPRAIDIRVDCLLAGLFELDTFDCSLRDSCSVHDVAAVDDDHLAGDEAAEVRQEVEHRTDEIVGSLDALQGTGANVGLA